ncbi:MAG TPA: serine/threonine-protein kinase, partial [Gemmatimonadales bacterium]|nr:serine/threonine-protein kinase [Gemmatimonadales bacterium]
MATVYLANDLRHDRPVALKVLHPELAATLGPERFQREIRTTARMQHPHILPVLDSGQAVGQLWYTMPYVEGESLRDRLRREGQLPLDDALQITREAADALGYAHSQGVVHRDIKPENILLSRKHALVADFGIARGLQVAGGDQLTATGMAVGTPAYMSPEQASGGSVDARSDIYALGCVLYEMLAGEPPYTGPSAQAIIAKRFVDPVPSISRLREVPANVDTVIRRALARTPADRFESAGAFVLALQGGQLVRSGTQAQPSRADSLFHSLRASGVIAALLIAMAGLAWWLTRTHSPAPERVAVYPFVNRTNDATLAALGNLSADWIAQAVARVPGVELVTMPSVMADPSLADAASGVGRDQLGKAAGAQTMIWGSIYRMGGDSLRLVANVTDVARDRLLGTVEAITFAGSPETGVQLLADRVTTGVITARSRDTTEMLMRSTRPPTFAAFQAFAEGMDWDNSEGSALPALQRAVALDSTFLSPLVWIGFIYRNRGDYFRADSVGSIAERQRDRLSPFEQAAMDRMLAEVRGDNVRAYLASRRVLSAAPSSDWAKCVTAEAALWINRPRVALRTLEGVETRPGVYNGAEWCDLVPFQAWLMIDNGDRALAAARGFRHKWRDSPWAVEAGNLEAVALAHLGRINEARLLADSAAAAEPESPLLLWAGHELRSAGDRQGARALFDRRVATLRHSRDTTGMAQVGEALYWAGHWNEASAIFRQLAGHPKFGVRAHGVLGVLAARRENEAEAKAEDAWLATIDPRHRRG